MQGADENDHRWGIDWIIMHVVAAVCHSSSPEAKASLGKGSQQ
jgi:hypothetical protein